MELRDSITVFTRRWKLSLALLVVTVGAAYAWAYMKPTSYATSVSFAVNRINKEQTPDYQYDGYYALQAADLFAQTVVSWLQTPSVLVGIYERAGLSTDVSSLRDLASRFKTKKYSAQNIVVTLSTPTGSEGTKLADAIGAELAERTALVNQNASNKAIFEVSSGKPVIVLTKPDPVLIGIVSFIVALTLILFAVPFVEYLAGTPRQG